MKVAVIYDPGSDDWTARDVAAVLANVHDVRDILRAAGHEVETVPVRLGDFRWLSRCRRADLVFNLCEGVGGVARFEDSVVAALELAGTPFTGPRSWPIAACHRKDVANVMLRDAGLPVPAFLLAGGARLPSDVPLPAIVKPAAEDASVGIDGGAVVRTRKALRQRVSALHEHFDDVLVQAYVAGREFNVGFVGDVALPVSEIDFSAMPEGAWPIVTYAAKWDESHPEYAGTAPVCPARIPADVARRLTRVAREAWLLLARGEGYGRVDLRLDEEGQPWVIEVNPCPDLSRDAGLARMAAAHGWEYPVLVQRIVDEALTRSADSRAAQALTAAGAPART